MLAAIRTWAIAVKEFRQLSRDRITFAMIVMIPLIQLMLFGYAINTEVRHVPSGVVNLSHSAVARHVIADLQASKTVDFINSYDSVTQAEDALRRGDVHAILYLPSDFLRRFEEYRLGISQRPIGQWITDASDPLLSSAIASLRQVPLAKSGLQSSNGFATPFRVVQFYNPERRNPVNIVPGLVAVILTMTMILFTSAAIVREREQGNMEFLINTPVQPIELMLGKITPYVVIGFIQTAIILSLGALLFAVPLPENIGSLLVMTLLFITSSLTLGLLISTRAQTQLQAMQLTVFILLPSILLSGFMFPYDAMPEPAQWIAEALPATHFVRSIRAVVLRDALWWELWPDVVFLAAFTLLGMLVATWRFQKRLD